MRSALGYVVVLLSGCLAAPQTSQNVPSCPRYEGLFPHPSDCHKFLHCAHGTPYVMDCPAQLEFNPKLLVCDWPENAGCVPGGGGDLPTLSPPDVVPDDTITCNCRCCLWPNPDDCRTYYRCQGGHAYLQACSMGLVFNPDIANCDLAGNYPCPSRLLTTPAVVPWVCPTPDGYFPDPDDCVSYYHCIQNQPERLHCPSGWSFNSEIKLCDNLPRDGCAVGNVTTPRPTQPLTTPAPKTTPVTVEPGPFSCPTPDGIFPNPKDCSTFWHCSNGHPYLKDCPAGLEFNARTQQCDYPAQAGCSSDDGGHSGGGSAFQCPTADGLFPNKDDCSTFWHCSNHIAYLKDCPSGLEFSAQVLRCEWPSVAGCSSALAENFRVPNQASDPFGCPTPDGLFPDADDCSKFWHCSNGIPHLKQCPGRLYFNPNLLVCDWREHSGCHPGEAPKFVPLVPESKPSPGVVCPSNTCVCRLPVEGNCSLFYQCISGRAYFKRCPAGLVFNRATEMCDLPSNVDGCAPVWPTTPSVVTSTHRTTPTPPPMKPSSLRPECPHSHSDSSDSDSSGSHSKHHHSHSHSKSKESHSKHHHSDSDSKSKESHHHSKHHDSDDDDDDDSKHKHSHSKHDDDDSKHKHSHSKHDDLSSKEKHRPSAEHGGRSHSAVRGGDPRLWRNTDYRTLFDDDDILAELCPNKEGSFPKRGSCNRYISCSKGLPTLRQCPPATSFYAPLAKCIPGGC